MYRLSGKYKNKTDAQKAEELTYSHDVFVRRLSVGCHPIFESNCDFINDWLEYNSLVEGLGAVQRNDSGSFTELCVTQAGDRVVRQSRFYVPYQIMTTRTIFCACTPIVTAGPLSNYTVKIGAFDDHNDKVVGRTGGDGYFFMLQGGVASWVQRSSVDSEQSDMVITQSSWNNDRLDGTGRSGYTFNPRTITTVCIEDSCSDCGLVRVGFIIDGQVIYVHNFVPPAERTKPVVKTARVPVRYELICNSGSVPASLYQTASSAVLHTNNYMSRGVRFSYTTPTYTRISDGPVLSIRCSPSCNRSTVFPRRIEILNLNFETTLLWSVVINGILTGSNFQPFNPCSVVEIDTSATAIVGGITGLSGLVSRGSASIVIPASEVFHTLGSAIDGTPDTGTVCVKSISPGNIDVLVCIEWVDDR